VSVLAGRGPWSAAPRRAAGTRPERFHAASSVPVIRVAPRHHRRICAPGVCRPGPPYSPRQRAERGHERRTRSRRAEAGPGRAVPARLGRRPSRRFQTAALPPTSNGWRSR
jgi:hypothetical protein